MTFVKYCFFNANISAVEKKYYGWVLFWTHT